MKRIVVIIPTYNSWLTLNESIQSIKKQTVKPSQIIVVDNASTDGTSQKVKAKYPEVNLVTLNTNTGVTGGRNEGIRKAKNYDYLLFFDHDMVADKRMLESLIETSNLKKNIGIVTPKIFYFNNKQRIWSAGTGINLWNGQILFRGGKDTGQYDIAEEVQVAPAALLVKKEVMQKIKFFDNSYFATYEDTDFCFNAKEKGYITYYSPRAIAYHKISFAPKDDAKRVLSRAYWVGRNRVIFMKRYSNFFLIFVLFIPIYALYYLYLAIKINKLGQWFNFIWGTLLGLLFIPEKYIPFSYIELIRGFIGYNITTILDLGCGEGKLIEALSKDEDWEVTGVDAYKPALAVARGTGYYKNIIFGDIETVSSKLRSQRRKYDVVLCSQVLEHLPKEKGEKLLKILDSLAKKRIVISTPRGYLEQIEESLGHNKYQEHVSGWLEKDFSTRGYRVKGTGLSFVWSYSGLARNKSHTVALIFRLIAFLISPLVYFFPALAINLIATKNIENS